MNKKNKSTTRRSDLSKKRLITMRIIKTNNQKIKTSKEPQTTMTNNKKKKLSLQPNKIKLSKTLSKSSNRSKKNSDNFESVCQFSFKFLITYPSPKPQVFCLKAKLMNILC